MDHNEISMCLDVKLDTHDKRALALRYKTWTRCQVKIEAIKCVPCFLRLSFQEEHPDRSEKFNESAKLLSISVNVPGVSISLATSRTKQHSYGLFWMQNRRDCFIYFALETELACRRHMKWVKKSIKNLELYRQVFLEQRRLSRIPRPLPNLPESSHLDSSNISARVSQIYEEIFDGSRISRASLASGIYEEMKPSKEMETPTPPPLPQAHPYRKRINTFECNQPGLSEIPRCSTNPESEMAKKKKYKNMLDNIFGSGKQKQEEEKVILYENAPTPPLKRSSVNQLNKSQRNSFSSPDLSKLNFLDTFGEAFLTTNESVSDVELNISLDESAIEPVDDKETRQQLVAEIARHLITKADSLESLNVSEQLPHNFNFSACNTSTINLIGAHGAVPHSSLVKNKNKILVDDLTGYCVMAPIKKKDEQEGVAVPPQISTGSTGSSTSSGYSTKSYTSSSSSCHVNTEEQQLQQQQVLQPPTTTNKSLTLTNESAIYEPMHNASSLNNTDVLVSGNGFAEHLYENLLAIKAAQELEQQTGQVQFGLSSSTPTESPLLPTLPQKGTPKNMSSVSQAEQAEEDYYQTPRKSIISIDDKVPSYYPNSCDSLKSKRHHHPSSNLRHLVGSKLSRQRKENLYISSPQQIIEQRHKTKSFNNKKTAAHKISEGVYAVTHAGKRPTSSNSNNNNNNNNNNINENDLMMERSAGGDVLNLSLLKNIDFKFDDSQEKGSSPKPQEQLVEVATEDKGDDYENCYQAAEQATRLLQKYATLAKFGNSPSKVAKDKQLLAPAPPMTQSVVSSETGVVGAGGATSSTGNTKKFASLPRFKKIDFSPLRMRINNVLQRNSPSPQQ
ncbi:putative mediator of RNA polymerase II transcription subunit 26 [Drosophila tropicalis]|uniref:putative mediator of RNA polymerase II transcription subunit 26 n=1 Tax=Drosophila tropicalis TaxID=46794 RepID=UPI0035ABD259